MHKINILYVITKLELGGAQKQLLSLITCLDKEKFNIFLFTSRNGLLELEARSIVGLTLRQSRFLKRSIDPVNDILALIDLFIFITRHHIDIVHTHSSKAGILGRLAAKLARVKIVIHSIHGWSFNNYQSFLVKNIFVWLERFAAEFTHKIIAVSNYDRQKGLDNRIGSEDKYTLIRYGINYNDFAVDGKEIRKELGINESDLVTAMIACFKPQKSPQDFIKLALAVKKIIPESKFILVGDGALRKKIERLIFAFDLEKHVVLTGWRRDIPRILSAIDVFALTS